MSIWLFLERNHRPGKSCGWLARRVGMIVLSGALVAFGLSACRISTLGGTDTAGSYSLTVVNGTDDRTLCSVRIKNASSQTFWGRNRLGAGRRLQPGDIFVIAGLEAGYYDVDAHPCDDDSHPGFGRYDVKVGDAAESIWHIGQ